MENSKANLQEGGLSQSLLSAAGHGNKQTPSVTQQKFKVSSFHEILFSRFYWEKMFFDIDQRFQTVCIPHPNLGCNLQVHSLLVTGTSVTLIRKMKSIERNWKLKTRERKNNTLYKRISTKLWTNVWSFLCSAAVPQDFFFFNVLKLVHIYNNTFIIYFNN